MEEEGGAEGAVQGGMGGRSGGYGAEVEVGVGKV